MQNFLNKNLIKKTLLILFFIELLSFLSHVFPSLNIVSFFILIIFTLILSIKDLKYGVIIVLVELLISSKGYLFYLEFDENKFPIRIALWGIVMYVWFIQEIYNFIKNKKIDLSQYDKKYIYYLIGLLVFVLCGIVNGFLNNNFKSNIFNDVNAWFYFLLIFPVLKTLSTNENKKLFLNYFLIGTSWTSLKTLFLFYLFTHDFSFLGLVYKWIRDTGVGEITRMQGGFYRIFFQTHIFIILAFFISFNYLLALYKQKTKYHNLYITFFGLSVLFLSVNILNFSRSNWLGILFGFVMYTLIIFWVHGVKNLFYYFKNIFKVLFFSFIIFYLIIEFPLPIGDGNSINMGKALKERTRQIEGEAGASSRWALLPKLTEKIKQSPILGQGFGSTVTYPSSDPRIKNEENPEGNYTTFAFEWGWLDIWIKLGVFGLIIYLTLIFKILFKKFSIKNIKNLFTGTDIIKQSVFIGVLVICIVHIFSPYLNHPLGIGYLIIASLYLNDDVV